MELPDYPQLRQLGYFIETRDFPSPHLTTGLVFLEEQQQRPPKETALPLKA